MENLSIIEQFTRSFITVIAAMVAQQRATKADPVSGQATSGTRRLNGSWLKFLADPCHWISASSPRGFARGTPCERLPRGLTPSRYRCVLFSLPFASVVRL